MTSPKQRTGHRPIVLGTGLLALDVIIGPDPANDPVLMAGGTCGNVLSALSYLGWESFPVARLNGDAASQKVRRDLVACGVNLEFATQQPGVETPVIVQTVRRDRDGVPKHRFSLVCPDCGAWYPSYRAVTMEAAAHVAEVISDARPGGFEPSVFFFDRVSRGTLDLAAALAAEGALIVFEPAGIGDPKLFAAALEIADILKYSRERLPDFSSRGKARSVRLEIETLGADGLRYRSASGLWSWHHAGALPAPLLVDTAGAGDWCTAGIIASLGREGKSGMDRWTSQRIEDAIRYGQATAALACAYLGPRGVMYSLARVQFDRAVSAILHESQSVAIEPPAERKDRRRLLSGPKDVAALLCAAC